MHTLPIPIDSDSTVKEPHGMCQNQPDDHKFSYIATIKNE